MENASLIISAIKGIVVAVIIFLFCKLYIALEWALSLPRGINIVYYVIQVLIISLILNGKSFKKYSISITCFIIVSILLAIILNDVDNTLFQHIFGLDSEMGTGDGFMLLSILLMNIIVGVIGIAISAVLTFYNTRKNKHKK